MILAGMIAVYILPFPSDGTFLPTRDASGRAIVVHGSRDASTWQEAIAKR